MATPYGGKQAVILSGGGANGAYEVGVMKALFAGLSPATNHEPLAPDIFTGTSVGSYNAAFLVAQWDTYGSTAIANLEQVWLDRVSDSAQQCGNGVLQDPGQPAAVYQPPVLHPKPAPPFHATGHGQRLSRLGRAAAGRQWGAGTGEHRCCNALPSWSTLPASSRCNPSHKRCMRRSSLPTSAGLRKCCASLRPTGKRVL